MDFFIKNKIKHILIVLFSTLLLFPLIGFLNSSYYTTISRVNYWEEKTISGLIIYILNENSDEERLKSLIQVIEKINYFDIKITSGERVIIHKPLKNYVPNDDQASEYLVKNYKLTLTRRKYDSPQDDYIYYLKSWASPSKLFGNRTFTVLIGHITIFLFIELIWIIFSIHFRMKQLQLSIKRNLS